MSQTHLVDRPWLSLSWRLIHVNIWPATLRRESMWGTKLCSGGRDEHEKRFSKSRPEIRDVLVCIKWRTFGGFVYHTFSMICFCQQIIYADCIFFVVCVRKSTLNMGRIHLVARCHFCWAARKGSVPSGHGGSFAEADAALSQLSQKAPEGGDPGDSSVGENIYHSGFMMISTRVTSWITRFGPVWYTIYHPLPVVKGSKQTPLIINQTMGMWDIYGHGPLLEALNGTK